MVGRRYSVVADESEQGSLTGAHKVGDVGRHRHDRGARPRRNMGIVYLALVRGPGGFNKLFVVKVLKAHLADDPNVVSMFLEEARLAAKLSHPNVVQTTEVGSDGGRHFIAMEFLDGQSFHRVLARGRRTGANMPLSLPPLRDDAHPRGPAVRARRDGLRRDAAQPRAPRRQPAQRVSELRRAGQDPGLRDRQGDRLVERDANGDGQRQGRVHGARAGRPARRLDRRADVFAGRRDAVGVRHRPAHVGSRSLNDLQILHRAVEQRDPSTRVRRRSGSAIRVSSRSF